MPAEIYEVVAQGARYWFLFLMAVIAWRSYRWLAKDRRQRKKRLKLLPDAGFVGELVVLTGGDEVEAGDTLPVPQEGVLGTHRGCDLYIPAEGVARKHLWFRYEAGRGVMIKPFSGCKAILDGEEITRKDEKLMLHGSRLTVGEVELRLRMFAGFETTARAHAMGQGAMPQEDGEADPEQEQTAAQQAALWQARQTALQQQYWLMAQQALVQQMAAQAGQAALEADEPEDTQEADEDTFYAGEEESTADGAYPDEDDEAQGYTVLTEEKRRPRSLRSLFSPFEPLSEPEGQGQALTPGGDVAMPAQTFYPPVADDSSTDFWPYAQFPQSSAVFENQGYTYPEYVEGPGEDEDMTDAAAPPKSLYVEPDEAEKAKRLLWDKYFGGGKTR